MLRVRIRIGEQRGEVTQLAAAALAGDEIVTVAGIDLRLAVMEARAPVAGRLVDELGLRDAGAD